FTFPATLSSGQAYAVVVRTQPVLQACTVSNGSGSATANVSNVAVTCADVAPPVLTLSLKQTKVFHFEWNSIPGSTHYRLLENPTGNGVFAQVGSDIAATAAANGSFDHVVALYRRLNARYVIRVCNGTRCLDSTPV